MKSPHGSARLTDQAAGGDADAPLIAAPARRWPSRTAIGGSSHIAMQDAAAPTSWPSCSSVGFSTLDHPSLVPRSRDVDAKPKTQTAAGGLPWRWTSGTSYPARGTILEAYLLSRGLTMPVPPTLRMHGLMWH